MPIHSHDHDISLHSSIGRGPAGHSVSVSVVEGDPSDTYRLQFKDAVTDEVFATTPNMDPGARIHSYNDTALDISQGTYIAAISAIDATGDIRIGDYVLYKGVDGDGINYLCIGMVSAVTSTTVTFSEHFKVSGSIGDIANGSITTEKLADSLITTAKLAAGSVTMIKLASDSVSTAKIIDGAVTTNKLADDSVTADKLADGSVSADTLADDSVTTDKLVDGAVTYEKLSDDATVEVTGNIRWFQNLNSSSSSTIERRWFSITQGGQGGITASCAPVDPDTGLIPASNIPELGTDGIQDGSVTTAKLADGAVTDAKLVQTGGVLENVYDTKEVPLEFSFNGYIHYGTGVFTAHSTYVSTDYIELLGGDLWANEPYFANAGIAFYDANKVYISGHGVTTQTVDEMAKVRKVTVPSNAVYFRMSKVTLADYLSIVPVAYEGSVRTAYEKVQSQLRCFEAPNGADKFVTNVKVYGYSGRISLSNFRNNWNNTTGYTIYSVNDAGTRTTDFTIDVSTDGLTGHADYSTGLLRVTFDYDFSAIASGSRYVELGLYALVAKRCYVYGDAELVRMQIDTGSLQNGYIKYSDGTQNSHGTFKCTGFVPCPSGSIYVLQTYQDAAGLAFYDSEKSFVSGVPVSGGRGTYRVITVPVGAKYFRVSVLSTDYSDAVVYALGTSSSLAYLRDTKATEAEDNGPLDNIIHDGGYVSLFRTIGCIGDSLSSGHVVWNGGSEDMYDISWGQFLGRVCNSTVHNFSIGGLTAKTWWDMYGMSSDFSDNLCTMYTIGLNQNELNTSYTIGTSADVNMSDYNQNADSFYGNYAKIIQRIQELQPRARIFVITNPKFNAAQDANYNAPVRWMAENFDNVYLVDLYTYGSQLYTADALGSMWYGGHMTETGYLMASWHIGTYIDWIIRNNMDDFADVQFIGTNHTM